MRNEIMLSEDFLWVTGEVVSSAIEEGATVEVQSAILATVLFHEFIHSRETRSESDRCAMLAGEIAAYEAESMFITDLSNTMDEAGLLTEVGSEQLEAQKDSRGAIEAKDAEGVRARMLIGPYFKVES